MQYQLTPLEKNIQELYNFLEIDSPKDIDMEYIADKLDIWIHYWDRESKMHCANGLYSIILDKRKSKVEQWLDFAHELGHVVSHVGNQNKMYYLFKKLQERQAHNFMYHFCVPTFMLLNYQLNEFANIEDGVYFISETFNVNEEFARVRLCHFRNQLLLAKSDAEHRAYMESRYSKASPYSKETLDVLDKLNYLIAKRKGAI
ncbi:ImmA/IrrE family metallo-endopeptidase [Cytobacillus firmus]|uniref:Putative Rad3 helicase n=1 Tax=Cytobacillus firmus DS1 TaxID=1307436 RepID=W7KN28_CYTFI|nr:ImmA/IrrE family metallo-endopeptidase [Cytobacillus firmus]EWG08860.1 putative Rad3 helicase [Cytobacillus firmus DS1]